MSLLPKEEIDILGLAKSGYTVQFQEVKGHETLPGDIDIIDAVRVTVSLNNIPQTPDGSPSFRYIDKDSEECIAAIWTNTKGQPHRIGPAVVHERSETTGAAANTFLKDMVFLVNGELHSKRGEPTIFKELSNDGINYRPHYAAYYQHNQIVRDIIYDKGEVEFDSDEELATYNQDHSEHNTPPQPL